MFSYEKLKEEKRWTCDPEIFLKENCLYAVPAKSYDQIADWIDNDLPVVCIISGTIQLPAFSANTFRNGAYEIVEFGSYQLLCVDFTEALNILDQIDKELGLTKGWHEH